MARSPSRSSSRQPTLCSRLLLSSSGPDQAPPLTNRTRRDARRHVPCRQSHNTRNASLRNSLRAASQHSRSFLQLVLLLCARSVHLHTSASTPSSDMFIAVIRCCIIVNPSLAWHPGGTLRHSPPCRCYPAVVGPALHPSFHYQHLDTLYSAARLHYTLYHHHAHYILQPVFVCAYSQPCAYFASLLRCVFRGFFGRICPGVLCYTVFYQPRRIPYLS